jgi:hypothetical protein
VGVVEELEDEYEVDCVIPEGTMLVKLNEVPC